ncbi:hypothetical protein HAQ00_00685 [Acidithiobacillus caldus ATCC 51756]|uniref:hypothetical protein n=1 Tax=Acidithiobacillus caldus TaxID=33059 RepID=UPI001C06D4A1|nr:hypothetical protein [Acidithiobacillus caldus]MBU2734270.1 hypothetical protein [Acidithiobacillus caldus ATCC 51756]MBU2801748.1 hypothetical protein [Acidithiobacillus caldus]
MRDKRYQYQLEGTIVFVEAEAKGERQYLVNMQIPGRMARVDIGYLTGAVHAWAAEFFGGRRPAMRAGSAKAACRLLAQWAQREKNIAPYFSSQES